MFDVRISTAFRGAELGKRLPQAFSGRRLLWAPLPVASLAAMLVLAGCSWFSDDTPAPAPGQGDAKVTVPAPGEGEAMKGDQTAPNQTAEATTPDINSVPTEAPKPSIVNLDQANQGLGADTGNTQHTDETLTMPNETAERPGPAPSATPQAAENAPVAPTAPETAPAAPVVNAQAATPPAATPSPTMPATTTPATQVALVGTPQPGSKPFEPSGPLNLAPGSLSRNPQEAAAAGISKSPMTAPAGSAASVASSDGVAVDYSVLGGLKGGSGGNSSYEAAVAASQSRTAMPAGGAYAPATSVSGGQVAGVGQAVGYVYFGNGSSALSASDRSVLQQVAQLQRMQGGVLRIIGHASQRTGNLDPLEQDGVNRQVALARAAAVARELVAMGVQPMLVQVAAAGDNQTLYSESTPAGEAGNRRAEVYLSAN
jgi:outer membrane protein OmpA-like peptidoglycan-associated protein